MIRSKSLLVFTLLLVLGSSALASAATISAFTGTVTSSDPTQVGRLFRDGIVSDWSAPKAYPGWTTTTTFNYHVYTLANSMFDFGPGGYAGYVQISVDFPSTSTFVSAFKDLYVPNNAANYLGDGGASGNFTTGDPRVFQVYLPQGHDLLVVINTTASSGLGNQLPIIVEGFVDTMYTDPTPVPEPASMLLLGSGLVGMVRAVRRRARS